MDAEPDNAAAPTQGESDQASASDPDAAGERRRSRGLVFWAVLLIAVVGASAGLTFGWLNREHIFFITPTDLSRTTPEPTGQTPTPSNPPPTQDTVDVQTAGPASPVEPPSQTPVLQTPVPITPPADEPTPDYQPTPELIPRLVPTPPSSSSPTPSFPRLTPTSHAPPPRTAVVPRTGSSPAPRTAVNPAPRQPAPALHR
jgi:hypothetical protein